MTKFSHLSWSQSASAPRGERVQFTFDPAVGLSDIDFHVITGRGWDHMKSPGPDAVAEVEVAPQTTADQMEKVIEALSQRGGYLWIEVNVRH
jgi:hypothetical protein